MKGTITMLDYALKLLAALEMAAFFGMEVIAAVCTISYAIYRDI
jgi:hypothetical protein